MKWLENEMLHLEAKLFIQMLSTGLSSPSELGIYYLPEFGLWGNKKAAYASRVEVLDSYFEFLKQKMVHYEAKLCTWFCVCMFLGSIDKSLNIFQNESGSH